MFTRRAAALWHDCACSLREPLLYKITVLLQIMESVKERARSGKPVSKKEFSGIVQQVGPGVGAQATAGCALSVPTHSIQTVCTCKVDPAA